PRVFGRASTSRIIRALNSVESALRAAPYSAASSFTLLSAFQWMIGHSRSDAFFFILIGRWTLSVSRWALNLSGVLFILLRRPFQHRIIPLRIRRKHVFHIRFDPTFS